MAVSEDQLAEVVRLADALSRVDVSGADRGACDRVLAALAVVRRRADACEVRVARRLEEQVAADPTAPPPEDTLAAAARLGVAHARRALRRGETHAQLPVLGGTVDRGEAGGEHLDVVGAALARLPERLREPFRHRHDDDLAAAASSMPPDELRRHVMRLVARFEDEQDRAARFARQLRSVQLRWWVDPITGMVRLAGELDPDRGQALLHRLHDEVEARFHAGVPGSAPDDPLARQHHLRALALVGIVLGEGAAGCEGGTTDAQRRGLAGGDVGDVGHPPDRRPGGAPRPAGRGTSVARRPETITVIDARTLVDGWHAASHVDLGCDGLELPLEVLRRRAADGVVVPVWVDGDGVVVRVGDPAEPLDLGRSTRLANRAQRRALRVMHPTCGVPGCTVPFDHCQPHHLRWWRHGGRTDMCNLLPLCTRHHHLVHEGGWRIDLAADRSVTVTFAGGTVLRAGPPRSRWSAPP